VGNYKPVTIYYESLDSLRFHAGWFIMNRKFAKRSDLFVARIDSLARANYFSKAANVDDIGAFFIDRQPQLTYLTTLASH